MVQLGSLGPWKSNDLKDAKGQFSGTNCSFSGSVWLHLELYVSIKPCKSSRPNKVPGPTWMIHGLQGFLTTIWFAKFETCTWTTAYVKCRLGIFKKVIDPLVEWKISNELYVPGWQNWHWGGSFVPLNSHVNRGSQISHSKVTQSDSASCPKLLSPPLLDNSETLCRPFGEIGAAFVLRIQLAASHFMVPFITFAPNVALLPGKKRLGLFA